MVSLREAFKFSSMGIAASVLELPLKSPGRVMLVTAHPDDESMFFVPVVQSLRAMKLHIMLLCLCDGAMSSLVFIDCDRFLYLPVIKVFFSNRQC